MNRRRKLVIALGASALAAPFGLSAQPQGKVWRVGFLSQSVRPESFDSHFSSAFSRGMHELGYVEGKNLVIEWRYADNNTERLLVLAAELVQRKVDAIVASSTPATAAAQKATTTIPIVMTSTADPVGSGFVKSLAHPGGNITGLSNLAVDVGPKQLEMLRSMVPKLSHVNVLVNPTNPFHSEALRDIQDAARRTGVMILPIEARAPQEIDDAFARLGRQKAEGLIVIRDAFFNNQVRLIAILAAKKRLPTISGIREYVDAGGLMSYGRNLGESYRRAATYVDKILKGAKPADLPVEQPNNLELIINGKTAKALGLRIPQSLLIMADKVIE